MSRNKDEAAPGRSKADRQPNRLVSGIRTIIAEARAKAQIATEGLGRTDAPVTRDSERRAR